jgi:hypothetical protein
MTYLFLAFINTSSKRSVRMPKKKWLREFTLNVAKQRNIQTGYRDGYSILDPHPRRVLEFKRGVPIFSKAVDTIQSLATGNRQYKPPVAKAPLVTGYDERDFHEMIGKFQFHVDGHFPNGGTGFEAEIHNVASDLHLLGFIKARSRYAMGHLQGDVYAMSYMRKWLQDRCNESGKIDYVHIFGDSYGLPEYRYTKLECIKDWRSPVRRRQHMAVLQEEARILELERKTREHESQRQASIEANHVRDF